MKRVLIIGCAGAGKTTLAHKLVTKLNLPFIQLDYYYWLPGWKERNFDFQFLKFVWRFAVVIRPYIVQTLALAEEQGVRVIVLKDRKSITKFLEEI